MPYHFILLHIKKGISKLEISQGGQLKCWKFHMRIIWKNDDMTKHKLSKYVISQRVIGIKCENVHQVPEFLGRGACYEHQGYDLA